VTHISSERVAHTLQGIGSLDNGLLNDLNATLHRRKSVSHALPLRRTFHHSGMHKEHDLLHGLGLLGGFGPFLARQPIFAPESYQRASDLTLATRQLRASFLDGGVVLRISGRRHPALPAATKAEQHLHTAGELWVYLRATGESK